MYEKKPEFSVGVGLQHKSCFEILFICLLWLFFFFGKKLWINFTANTAFINQTRKQANDKQGNLLKLADYDFFDNHSDQV